MIISCYTILLLFNFFQFEKDFKIWLNNNVNKFFITVITLSPFTLYFLCGVCHVDKQSVTSNDKVDGNNFHYLIRLTTSDSKVTKPFHIYTSSDFQLNTISISYMQVKNLSNRAKLTQACSCSWIPPIWFEWRKLYMSMFWKSRVLKIDVLKQNPRFSVTTIQISQVKLRNRLPKTRIPFL